MTDSFAEAVGRVILGATELEEQLRGGGAGMDSSLEAVRGRLVRLVDGFARDARRSPGREEDYELARCALVCWLDEVFTVHCPWPSQQAFRARCLELQYPEVHIQRGRKPPEVRRPVEGPTLFYEMAEVARRRPEVDAIETYYLCVALGFKGRLLDEDERRAWLDEVYAHIRERQPAESDGPPAAAVADGLRPLHGARLRLGVALLTAATALLTLLAFIVAVHRRPY
jgi:type VI secretion system protein ImpK